MPNQEIKKEITTLIRPAGQTLFPEIRELWQYRELLFFLTWRDVKVRYKQTAVGVVWAILQPVLTTAIFTVIFSTIAKFDSKGVPYPLFALSGFLVWLFVFNSITFSANSLISNTNLVTKVYFPRMIVPISATFAALLDLLFSAAVLAVLMGFYVGRGEIVLSPAVLAAPLFILLATVMTIALGTMFAALNVRYRDVKFALPFALQVWMFASPIFYPPEILSEKARLVLSFNPLFGVLQGLRASLFNLDFDWFSIGVSVVGTILLSILAIAVFRRLENSFADVI